MKKIMCITAIIIILLLSSCAENISPQTDRLEEIKAQYDQVGIAHNLALDEIHTIYKDQNESLGLEDYHTLADEYFRSTTETSHNIAKHLVSLVKDVRLFAKSTVNAEVIDDLSDSIEIISKYPVIFDSISVILDAPVSMDEKTNKLEGIYLLVDDTVEDIHDKESIMNGVATIIHSNSYWDENYSEWQHTLNGSIGKASIGIVGALGIVDGVGAVIGTLEGIRDTYKGQEGRGRIILGRAIGEAAKTSTYAVLAIIML
jgi:hypothetical protein